MNSKKARVFALCFMVGCAAGLGEAQEEDRPVAISADDGDSAATKQWGPVVMDPEAAALGADDYELVAATLTGDTLAVVVSYGGGCEEHLFALDASAAFRESDPVQIAVELAHNANNDACEAWLTQNYFFDLTPLKTRYRAEYQQDAGAIVLQLAGAASELVYEFTAADGPTAVEDVSWGRLKKHHGNGRGISGR